MTAALGHKTEGRSLSTLVAISLGIHLLLFSAGFFFVAGVTVNPLPTPPVEVSLLPPCSRPWLTENLRKNQRSIRRKSAYHRKQNRRPEEKTSQEKIPQDKNPLSKACRNLNGLPLSRRQYSPYRPSILNPCPCSRRKKRQDPHLRWRSFQLSDLPRRKKMS